MPATQGSISEVLIGTGVLYLKDRTTSSLAFPTDAGGAFDTPTAMTPAWEEVGYSEDGWTLEMDKTFEDIMVAEEVDPIKTIKTAQEVRLTGELSQASHAKLIIALGGGASTSGKIGHGANGAAGATASGYNTLVPPTSSSFNEYAMLLVADGPKGTNGVATRHVRIPRAVSVGSFSMAHAKAPTKVVLSTEFKILVPDTTLNVGSDSNGYNYLFDIVDNTNAAGAGGSSNP
jgi:hypothetical protein